MSKLNPAQFGDSMTGQEIIDHVGLVRDMDAMHEEAWKSGLGGDIKKNWVKKPLTIWHRNGKAELADGHHRLAAAVSIAPHRPIPVVHQRRD